VDSDDDDERAQAAIVAAAESNPYADVRIERKNRSLMILFCID